MAMSLDRMPAGARCRADGTSGRSYATLPARQTGRRQYQSYWAAWVGHRQRCSAPEHRLDRHGCCMGWQRGSRRTGAERSGTLPAAAWEG
jgi:hypothetical protein